MAGIPVKLSDEDIEAIIDGVVERLEKGRQGKQRLTPGAFKAPGAAAYIGVSRARFYQLLKEHPELARAAISNGATRLWPKAFLDTWLERQQGAQIKLPEKTTKQSKTEQ